MYKTLRLLAALSAPILAAGGLTSPAAAPTAITVRSIGRSLSPSFGATVSPSVSGAGAITEPSPGAGAISPPPTGSPVAGASVAGASVAGASVAGASVVGSAGSDAGVSVDADV